MHTFKSNLHWWPEMYDYVLEHAVVQAPRGRKVLAIENVIYKAYPWEHFDATPPRKLSLDYIRREFLWFVRGDRYDTRMTEYAPIWKTCIQEDGGINSNYGQYLFGFNRKYASPFFHALERLIEDKQSRRCWIPIFQSLHQFEHVHQDYPCTTGMGFVIEETDYGLFLNMNVHMRSQDLVHGAGNDNPICFLFQLIAQAYLAEMGLRTELGTITHSVDNLHIYERHWIQAAKSASVLSTDLDIKIMQAATALRYDGFTWNDLEILFNRGPIELASDCLRWVLDIEGAYGWEDPKMTWWIGEQS